MKPTLVMTSLLSLAIASGAHAGGKAFYDSAKVTRVDPIYRSVEHRVPEQQCWVEEVRREYHQPSRRSPTSTLVGGVIGGALGHAVGNGSKNKKIGAVVGTVLGASIGSDVGRKRAHPEYTDVRYEEQERCETRYRTEVEERLTGYDVTYKYRGETYTTRMDEHPGDRIQVSVSVRPVVR